MSETKTGIGGKVRENKEFGQLLVGLGEFKVILVNPSTEEYKEVLGIDLKEESKAAEYLGESKEGNRTARIDIWVENIKTQKRDKIVFFLEDKKRENKDKTKNQYINNLGVCSWADDVNNLPEWFAKRDYREAYNGEEEFYSFLRTWLGKLDLRDAEATLQLEWKRLIKGDVRDVKSQIDGEFSTTFVGLYTVKTVDKDGESKQYQAIYNKEFLPNYTLKNFNNVDYDKQDVLDGLKKKKSKELKPYERFALSVKGEHGPKDSFVLKPAKEFNPDDFLVASDKVMDESDPSY
jgi:hypothetical protein